MHTTPTHRNAGKEPDMEDQTPTKRGIEKYPPDGFCDGDPCVCKDDCEDACKGACGCMLCRMFYVDSLEWD